MNNFNTVIPVHFLPVTILCMTLIHPQAFLKFKPSLLVAVPSQAGYDGVQCFSFNSNAAEVELAPVECVPGPVSNHLVQNTVMVRLSASLPLFLTRDEKGINIVKHAKSTW